jgi:hypothetical protein
MPFPSTPQRRTLFLERLEQTRQRYRFVVAGYVGSCPDISMF